MPRSLLSISDLAPKEILSLFRRGEDAAGDPLELDEALTGKLVAGLFWQPAPRVEAALRAACARAGASYVNGRELWPGFPAADLLVMRHPVEGAAWAASRVAGVPVLNAGDGARENPVRALQLIRQLVSHSGGGVPRAVAVCGDLRQNPTAHSLAAGLSALGTTVLLVPAKGSEMPEFRIARLGRRTGHQPVRFAAQSLRSIMDMVDTVVVSPEIPYQHPLFGDLPSSGDDERHRARGAVQELDALFVAAPRTEEGASVRDPADFAGATEHPWLSEEGRLEYRPFGGEAEAPVPGQLQAESAREIPLLASVLVAALGTAPGDLPRSEVTGSAEGIRCPHLRCIVHRDARVAPSYLVTRKDPLVLDCRACGTPVRPRFAGSRKERHYHRVEAADVRKVLPSNLVYFASWQEAESSGWTPARARRPEPDEVTADGGGA
ncbi:MAG: hypothetical protein ACYTDX_09020 [Planctomycetota bacterium]|jgi:hypothetical protein